MADQCMLYMYIYNILFNAYCKCMSVEYFGLV